MLLCSSKYYHQESQSPSDKEGVAYMQLVLNGNNIIVFTFISSDQSKKVLFIENL